MNNEPFFFFLLLATKRKFTQLLGTTKLAPLLQVNHPRKKQNKCYPLVSGRENNSRGTRDMRRGWKKKKGWNIRVSPPPHLKSKTEGWRRGAVEKQQAWMGRRAFTDDCSPVWAAKLWTWTSFISLQGHCPQREGSCHPALTSPHWDSQLLKIPTSQRHGTLWKSSRRREKQQHSVRPKD